MSDKNLIRVIKILFPIVVIGAISNIILLIIKLIQ